MTDDTNTTSDTPIEWPDKATAVSANNWQPIESAPRDGTWLLCYWSAQPGSHYPDGHPIRYDIVNYVNGKWRNEEGTYAEPTHWQPLPPPPQQP